MTMRLCASLLASLTFDPALSVNGHSSAVPLILFAFCVFKLGLRLLVLVSSSLAPRSLCPSSSRLFLPPPFFLSCPALLSPPLSVVARHIDSKIYV
ncbi:hypothetical protein B0H13DRAFT_2328888 [Mycena leptocephala]|nr:hypothetical protein B0H13DRAFT_2328888 [Mycena leptocephala]